VGLDAALLYICSKYIRIPTAAVYVSQKMGFYTITGQLVSYFFNCLGTYSAVFNCLFRGLEKCCLEDTGAGAFLTPGSGIRDPGWVKNQDPDPGRTSRIRFPTA
jgi:hypothetical protein